MNKINKKGFKSMLRGGGWADDDNIFYLRVSSKIPVDFSHISGDIGFRMVRTIGGRNE